MPRLSRAVSVRAELRFERRRARCEEHRVGAVWSLRQKAICNETIEHEMAGATIDLPETARLRESETQAGHLAIFAANSSEQVIVCGHLGDFHGRHAGRTPSVTPLRNGHTMPLLRTLERRRGRD
jgi:hypothetical protein